MLELVDRHDSGSCARKSVEVQVLSRAIIDLILLLFEFFCSINDFDKSIVAQYLRKG